MPITEDIKEEILRLETAIVEDPNSMEYFPLAELYRGVGELEKALKICQDGLSRHPNDNEGLITLGKILMDMGDLSGAKNALTKAQEKYSENDPQVLLLLGQLHLASGDLASLKRVMTVLKSKFPADVRVNKFWAFLSQQGIVSQTEIETSKSECEEIPQETVEETTIGATPPTQTVSTPQQELKQKPEEQIIPLDREKLLKLIAQVKAFPGVAHVVLLDSEGKILASKDCPTNLSSAMGSILKAFKRALGVAFKSLEFGSWQRGVVELELLTIHIVEIRDSYLAIMCESKVSMGALRVALDVIIRKVLSLD